MSRSTLTVRPAVIGSVSPASGARARPRRRTLAVALLLLLAGTACGPGAAATGDARVAPAEPRTSVSTEGGARSVDLPDGRQDGGGRAPAHVASEDATTGAADREPSSARLGELPATRVAAPSSLRIPAIEVRAPIEPTGIDGGAFDVLDGVSSVGWYRHGPSPGEAGSAVLAAHVDTARDGPGIFFDLTRLSAGDRVEVLRDDGQRITFEVTSVSRYDKADLPVEELFARTGRPRLTLITCGGAFDPVLGRYDDNVVVVARPVEG